MRCPPIAHLSIYSVCLWPLWVTAATAQRVEPDGTLPTQVQQEPGQAFVITGGAQRGSNLFHSFKVFSPGGHAVRFDLQADGFSGVEHIFSRVTGTETSYIDGLLQTVGGNRPDLFLLNPNGLIFGPNARLDLAGSFIATTAEAVSFRDGVGFSAIAPDASNLLSISIPVGLQLGRNPGSIALNGGGHSLTVDISNPILPAPLQVSAAGYSKGLAVPKGSTMALVGNGIHLTGGTIQSQSFANADAGIVSAGGVQLSLGSGRSGEVVLTPQSNWGWGLDYQNLEFLSDIELTNRSRVDGSGAASSTIRLHGEDVTLKDSSVIFSNYFGTAGTTNGEIHLYANGQLKLEGVFRLDESQIPSQIRNTTISPGNGGALEIIANSILLRDGARLTTDSFGIPGSPTSSSGDSGSVKLQVTEEIELSATPNAPLVSPIPSLISSSSFFSNGNGGGIDIESERLRIIDGSLLSSITISGLGDGSNIQIKAMDSVYVEGNNASNGLVSGISSSSFGQGDAGNILIDTTRVKAINGGYIEASVYAEGAAGNIIINATDSVDVGGRSYRENFLGEDGRASFIGSLVSVPPEVVELFGLPPVPTGETGKVVVDTLRLRLFDRGLITVINDGLGDAGQLEVSAAEISLDQASILAETAQGNGGNIRISDAETLLLRNGSAISASAKGGGNGGNIEIEAESVVAIPRENSDITANAANREGGRVLLETSSILGTQVRNQQTALSDITASSDLGPQFSGVVELVQPNIQPDSVVAALPKAPIDRSDRLAKSCVTNDSLFRLAGRGGLPWSPLDLPEMPVSRTDFAALTGKQGKSELASHSLSLKLVEAITLREQGLYPKALAQLEEIARAKSLPDFPNLQSQVMQQLGITYRLLGQQVKAKSALEKSLAIAEQAAEGDMPQSTQVQAGMLLSLGHLATTQSHLRQARQYYLQALEMAGDSEIRSLVFASLFSLEINHNNGQAANQWREQLYSQPERPFVSQTVLAGQLHGIATQLEAVQGEQRGAQFTSAWVEQTRGALESLLVSAQQQDDPRATAYSLGYLSQIEALVQNWQLAQQYAETALQLAQANGDELMAYQWAWQLGRVTRHRWDQTGQAAWYEQSRSAYQLALKSLQSLRSDLLTVAPVLQLSFRSAIEPVYREYIDLLLIQPTSEMAQPSGQLQEAINTAEALRLAELDNYLQDACLTTQPRSIAAMDGNAAVIYPIILRDRLEVIVSLPQGGMRRYSQPVGQADLAKTVQAFRKGLVWRSQQNFNGPSRQLYQWLIQPIIEDLNAEAIETLVLVPDGVLKNVPLAALSDGQDYLIKQFAVATAPGIELLPTEETADDNKTMLVAGIAQQRHGLPPLPFVSQELSDVRKSIPGQVLLDEEFTRQTFEDALANSNASIVHIATHGQFSSQASETYIQAWNEQISLVQLSDMLQRRAQQGLSPMELLVLSACETAIGDEAAALGLAGVAVRAGAQSTLASLWSVNDQSTAAFMKAFYQQLSQPGMSKAEALRQTQQEMLKDPVYRHPYYWSAFTLLGDWQ